MDLKEYLRDRRAALKSVGACVDCGKEEAREGHVLCFTCLIARSDREKKRRARRKAIREQGTTKRCNLHPQAVWHDELECPSCRMEREYLDTSSQKR